MTDEREQLIQSAEQAYREEQESWGRFRAFMCSHLGLEAGAQQAEVIIRGCDNLRTLPGDQLHLLTQFTPRFTPCPAALVRQVQPNMKPHPSIISLQ
jgi:hypothetical protein